MASVNVEESVHVDDVFKPLAMFLAFAYFISLMIFDAYVVIAGKPARIWIPAKSLVLSALMIQILSYLKVKPIRWSENMTSLDQSRANVHNVFVGESGRVVTCVLIAYLLPGMGRAGSATDCSTLVALALSLFTSEFYYSTNLFSTPKKGYSGIVHADVLEVFYINVLVSNMVIMVSIILLILFSISAILAGRRIRSMLAETISVIQRDKGKDTEVGSWEKFEGEIVESWFLARVCHPQYVIARSALSSAAGMVVAICILLLAIRQFSHYEQYSPPLSKFDIFFMGWTLEWAFILIGGTIIFCRWFMAVVYFPRFSVKNMKLGPLVEDYWTRGILELIEMYNLQKWRLQELSKAGISSRPFLRLATTMKVHYLLYLLWPLQVSLIGFSKGCLFISQLLFCSKFVRICSPGMYKVPSQSSGQFQHYREILKKVCMPGENPERLWVANEKSMDQAKSHFDESIKKGSESTDLINFIKRRFHLESNDEDRFFNQLQSLPIVVEHCPALEENYITMTALSLLNVIFILSPSEKHKLKDVCQQALDLMSFVDNSDPQCPTTIDMRKAIDIESDRVGLAVYNEFQSLPKLDMENPEAPQTIKELLKQAEEQLNKQKLVITNKEEQRGGEEQNFGGEIQKVGRSEHIVKEELSRDWSAIVGSYSKYRVCKLILSRHPDIENHMEYLYNSLADVIVNCLLRSPKVLVERCREWAVKFEEEKIWDAMYIAGKLVGVMQDCKVELKGKIAEPEFFRTTSNEMETV